MMDDDDVTSLSSAVRPRRGVVCRLGGGHGQDNDITLYHTTPVPTSGLPRTQTSPGSPGPRGSSSPRSAGKASGSVTFTLALEIVSFSPASGSVGGGTTLTITGTGFPDSLAGWEGNQVTIGGGACQAVFSTLIGRGMSRLVSHWSRGSLCCYASSLMP